MLVAATVGLLLAASPTIAVAAVVVPLVLGVAMARSKLGVAAVIALLVGLWAGGQRLAAIDDTRLGPRLGSELTVTGYLVRRERPARGQLRFRIELDALAPGERLQVRMNRNRAQDVRPQIGDRLRIVGELRKLPEPSEHADFDYRAYLRRAGVHGVLAARSVRATGERRKGFRGLIDAIRRRSEQGVSLGLPPPLAALARGMVLGQDEQISARTNEDFKVSGLAHLLAVSGQNVTLLALLALPVLGLLGVPRHLRLFILLALIGLYVPLTGAGPSIVRAGVMGAAGTLAALQGRPASRWYALLTALVVSLAIDPRAWQDVGWQLSFAAVVGIFTLMRPLRRPLQRLPEWLAEGIAMTVAATATTAPLMAHQFDRLSLVSLLANVLVLPAVAPLMWLGMVSAALGQVSSALCVPVNALNSCLLAYVAQVARMTAALPGASVSLRLDSLQLVAAYVLLFTAVVALRRRRSVLMFASRIPIATVLAIVSTGAIALASVSHGGEGPRTPARFQLVVLDVGQGDAILMRTPAGSDVLVDAGPPEARVGARLRQLGVRRLALLVLTHDQRDHSGGALRLLDQVGIGAIAESGQLRTSTAGRDLLRAAQARAIRTITVRAGESFRLSGLRLSVLNPARPGHVHDDPNDDSIVLHATYGSFDALLTADAEAEAIGVPYRSPVELLKVAHHGSADSGLARLLRLTQPQLAVISVGRSNPYGHPTPETIAALVSVARVLRTDRDGEVTVTSNGSDLDVSTQ